MRTPLILFIVILCISCKPKPGPVVENPEPEKKGVVFSGSVADPDGKPLENPTIEINGVAVKPSANGEFRVPVDSAGRYVINISKRGYGLISKIFTGAAQKRKYVLIPGTVKLVDPAQPIVVTGGAVACSGSDLRNVKWGNKKFESVPLVIDADGQLVDFGFPSTELEQAFKALSSEPPACSPGATVSIPANALVSSGNQAPPAGSKLAVSIVTVDLYSEDGMPGDWSFRNDKNQTSGYMQSMGAVMVDIYSEDGRVDYNLREKMEATIKVPVDPLQRKLRKKIPESIPLLTYDTKSGYWMNSGLANLNAKDNYYEGKVTHFSAFNMDIEKTTPGCVRFRQDVGFLSGNNATGYKVASLTAAGAVRYSITGNVVDASNTCHTDEIGSGATTRGWQLLYNLPSEGLPGFDDGICVAFYDLINGDPLGIYIVDPKASYGTTLPACPYNGTCANINGQMFTDPIFLAVRKAPAGNTASFKWIMNTDVTVLPASITQISYEIIKCQGGCTRDCCNDPAASGCTGCSTTRAASTITAATASDDPRAPTAKKSLSSISWATGDKFYVKVSGLPGGDKFSNVITL